MAVNKVILVGNLGKDPELRYTGSGTAVCNFSLATTENYKDRDGNKQEKTEWHNIVIWRQLAEIAGKYLTKGKQVYLEGKIQTRSYDDRDGNKRYITEIVVDEMQMLGRVGDTQGQGNTNAGARRESASRSEYGSGTGGGGAYQEPPFDPTDDVPF